MKRGRAFLGVFICCVTVFLTGCSMPEEWKEIITREEQAPSGGTGGQAYDSSTAGTPAENDTAAGGDNTAEDNGYRVVEETAVEESVSEIQQDTATVEKMCARIRGITKDELAAWDRLGMNDQSVESERKAQEGLYYYDALTEEQQFVYAEILMILDAFETDIIISETDGTEIDLVFQSVLADHPEIFYVAGYTYTKHMIGDDILRIGFGGTYTMQETEAAAAESSIDAYVETCMAGIPSGDDYAKIRYLYDYLIEHTEYSLNAPENQNICSVFLYGQSVCQGYAKAFEYLCRQCGIEATLVTGSIKENGYGHAWNLVRSDGAYYYVDVTWGDASYTTNGSTAAQGLPSVNYEYLCITTDQLTLTHEIETIVPMPYCSSMEDNYYVREQAYFTEFQVDELETLFRSDWNGTKSYVTFQCASTEVFSQYYEYLITEQNIFLYMNSDEGISYSGNADTNTLCFWIP